MSMTGNLVNHTINKHRSNKMMRIFLIRKLTEQGTNKNITTVSEMIIMKMTIKNP